MCRSAVVRATDGGGEEVGIVLVRTHEVECPGSIARNYSVY